MRGAAALLAFFAAASAFAQQRPIYDADDFVDPRTRSGPFFVSHLAAGAGTNLADDYRAVPSNGPFFEWANSVYWSRFELDLKLARAYTGRSAVAAVEQPIPIISPVPPPVDAVAAPAAGTAPLAPSSSPKETVQLARYFATPSGAMLRARMTWTRQRFDADVVHEHPLVAQPGTGRERTVGIDTDTHVRLGRRDVWGSLAFARNTRSGTVDDRAQNEIAYTNRFPSLDLGAVSLMPRFTAGHVSGRGGGGVNVVNPRVDVAYYHRGSGANVHLIYSPLAMRSGANGWETRHQLALLVDRALFAKMLSSTAAR